MHDQVGMLEMLKQIFTEKAVCIGYDRDLFCHNGPLESECVFQLHNTSA